MGNSAPWRSQGKPFIPGRFWHSPTNVISSDDLMWKSQRWNEIRKHQDATGIFPSHFPRDGLMFPCWCRFHWIIWGRFPHEYQIFHYKSALSCSVINPSPTASLGSNMRAPKSLFQEKSALCQAPPLSTSKVQYLGDSTFKSWIFGTKYTEWRLFWVCWVFFLWSQLGTGNSILKKPNPNVHVWFFKDLMDGWISCGPRHTRKIEGYPQRESRGCKTCIGVESWYMRKLEQDWTEPSSREQGWAGIAALDTLEPLSSFHSERKR